jgi:hypothetical protein
MYSNLNNLKFLLNSGEIDNISWETHFAEVPDTRVPACKDCLDRKNGTCSRDGDPVECFLYGIHAKSNEFLLKNTNAK